MISFSRKERKSQKAAGFARENEGLENRFPNDGEEAVLDLRGIGGEAGEEISRALFSQKSPCPAFADGVEELLAEIDEDRLPDPVKEELVDVKREPAQ